MWRGQGHVQSCWSWHAGGPRQPGHTDGILSHGLLIGGLIIGMLAESLSTLKFASRAKNVRNLASVNEDVDQVTLLRKYEAELRRLRGELQQRQATVVDKRHLLQVPGAFRASGAQAGECRSLADGSSIFRLSVLTLIPVGRNAAVWLLYGVLGFQGFSSLVAAGQA